jgi:predicted ATPase
MCLQIDPLNVQPMAEAADPTLGANAGNFVAWYRHRILPDMSAIVGLRESLRELYEDFSGLNLTGEEVQHLFLSLGVSEERGKPKFIQLGFRELSEGERALIILYTLLEVLRRDPDMTLCLDEPDNFLALAEIQPWLLNLKDAVEANRSQSLLISHHPELINYLAPSCGLLFEREKNGPVRVKHFEAETGDGTLTPSEMVARGWE